MHSPALWAVFVCVGAYTGMNMLFKRHASGGGGALALTAGLGLLAPVWLLALVLGGVAHWWVWVGDPAYWRWSLLWAVLLPVTTLLMVALLKSLSLSEVTATRKALVTLLALGTDALLLGQPPHAPALLAVAVITGAALALPGSPAPVVERPTLAVRAGLLGLLAGLLTLQLYAYKKALGYQPDLASHIVVVKLLAALACLPLALGRLRPAGSSEPSSCSLRVVLGIAALYFVGSVSEGYALRGLPLTVLVGATTATAALMAAHDLLRRDLPRSAETLALLALVFGGLVLLALA